MAKVLHVNRFQNLGTDRFDVENTDAIVRAAVNVAKKDAKFSKQQTNGERFLDGLIVAKYGIPGQHVQKAVEKPGEKMNIEKIENIETDNLKEHHILEPVSDGFLVVRNGNKKHSKKAFKNTSSNTPKNTLDNSAKIPAKIASSNFTPTPETDIQSSQNFEKRVHKDEFAFAKPGLGFVARYEGVNYEKFKIKTEEDPEKNFLTLAEYESQQHLNDKPVPVFDDELNVDKPKRKGRQRKRIVVDPWYLDYGGYPDIAQIRKDNIRNNDY